MTTQRPENLTIDGQAWWLHSFPLRPILRRKSIPDALFRSRTDTHRGYVGYWAVRDGQLWLIGLNHPPLMAVPQGPFSGPRPVDPGPGLLEHLFPGQQAPIPATWFTGALRAECGAVFFSSPFFPAILSELVTIRVRRGQVVRVWRREASGVTVLYRARWVLLFFAILTGVGVGMLP